MLPLFGTVKLVRKSWEDLKIGVCKKCKAHYHIKIMTDGKHELLQKGMSCPKCGTELTPEKHWMRQCPKCKRAY